MNKEERSKYNKQYRRQHLSKILENERMYREKHRKKAIEYQRLYRQKAKQKPSTPCTITKKQCIITFD